MAELPVETETSARAAKARKTRETVRDQAVSASKDMMNYLIAAANGEQPAKRERIDAAKTVLDRAGIVPPQRDSDPEGGATGGSLLEVRAYAAALKAELVRRGSESKLIDVTPQRIDIFD